MTQAYFLVIALVSVLVLPILLNRFGGLLLQGLGYHITDPWVQRFANSLAAVVVLVMFTAVIRTGLHTVFVLWIPLVSFLVWKRRSQMVFPSNVFRWQRWREGLGWTIYSLLFFILAWLVLALLHAKGIIAPHRDVVFYARIAENLIGNGSESYYVFGSQYLEALGGPTPYHFFDLWLTGLVSKATVSPPVMVYMLVVIPVLQGVFCLGIRALFNGVEPNRLLNTLAFLGVFVTGYSASFMDAIPLFKQHEMLTVNAITSPKVLPIYLFCLGAVLAWQHAKCILSLAMVLSLPMLSAAMGPAAYVISLVILFWMFIDRSRSAAVRWRGLIIITYMAIGFVAFYILLGNPIAGNSYSEGAHLLSDSLYQADAWYRLKTVPVGLPLVYCPWILLGAYIAIRVWKQARSQVVVAGLAMLCSTGVSFICWQLLRFSGWDSIQIFSQPTSALLQITALIVCASALRSTRNQRPLGVIVSVLMLACCWQSLSTNYTVSTTRNDNKHTPTYVKAVLQLNESTGNLPKAALLGPSAYDIIATKNSWLNVPGAYFSLDNDPDVIISLSALDIPISKSVDQYGEIAMREASFLNQFIRQQKRENVFLSTGQSKLDLIQELKVRLVLVQADAVMSNELRKILQFEAEDENTGERCYSISPSISVVK